MARNSLGVTPPETFDLADYQHPLDRIRIYEPTALFLDRVIRKEAHLSRGN